MVIKYIEDSGLKFLVMCEENDLYNLAQIIIYDTDASVRRTSNILTDEGFIKNINSPNKWKKSWQVIAGELQLYGGDSLVNFFRGNGVLYEEILSDVCSRVGVKLTDTDKDLKKKEEKLIEFLANKAWDNMSAEQRNEFLKKN